MKESIESYLGKDEVILWRGRPRTGIFFLNNRSLIYILRTVIWLFTIIIFSIGAFLLYANGAPNFMIYAGSTLVLIALFRLPFSYFSNDFRRRRTKYLITNKRIFIWFYSFGKRVKLLDIKKLDTVTLKEYSNAYGTILFNYSKPWTSNLLTLGTEYRWMDQSRRLEYIENARMVYQLIEEQRK